MVKLKVSVVVLIAAISFLLLSPQYRPGVPGPAGIADAQDDWKSEFETLCAKTQDSAALTSDELKNLLERCDKLKARVEKISDESQKKVYLKRLQMCRDLFAFVLESKENK